MNEKSAERKEFWTLAGHCFSVAQVSPFALGLGVPDGQNRAALNLSSSV